ncbi:MAG: hypothetical protein IKP00_06520 [Victivallales bacterium]|nr:hypothetical protein [Victivallales bacterium]
MLSFVRGMCHFIIIFVLVVSLMCNFLFIKQIAHLKQEERVERAEDRKGEGSPKTVGNVNVPPPPVMPVNEGMLRLRKVEFRGADECNGRELTGAIFASIDGLGQEAEHYKISVSPEPVRLSGIYASYYGDYVRINGTFEIGKTYTVTIKAGAVLERGAVLKNDFAYVLTVEGPKPSVKCLTEGPYFPVKIQDGKVTDWQLPVRVTNAELLKVVLWKQNNRNLDIITETVMGYWNNAETVYRMMNKQAEKSVPVTVVRNVSRDVLLDLGSIFPGLTPGLYGVEVFCEKGNEKNYEIESYSFQKGQSSRLVILSSLGISAVEDGDEKVAVCVRDLNTFEPVKEAEVSLVTAKRNIVATGKTGEDGTLLLTPGADGFLEHEPPCIVLVSKGSDISYIKLDNNYLNSDHEYPDADNGFKERYYAFGYTERGIYRMGDSVFIGAFVRERDDAELKAAAIPLEVEVSDPKGTMVFKQTKMTDANGFTQMEYRLSKQAFHGSYSVQFTCGKDKSWTHFQVGAFEPDRIRAKAAFDKDIYLQDDSAILTYSGEYFFGGTVRGAKYSLDVSLTETQPPHWKGYSVGQGSLVRAVPIYKKEGLLENTHSLPPFRKLLEDLKKAGKISGWSRPLAISAQVGVTDSGTHTVTARTSAVILPTTCFLGMKHVGAKGDSALFDCRLLAWESSSKPTLDAYKQAFALTLTRLTWEHVLVQENGVRRMKWELTKHPVRLNRILLMDSDHVQLELPEMEDGHYSLHASNGSGIETSIEFWHEKGEAGSIHSEHPYILTVQSDKEKYLPGDTAVITFHATGEGNCFVAAGENGLDYQAASTVKKGQNSLSIVVPKGIQTARYYATVTVVTQVGDNLSRSFGLVSLPVEQEAHRMKLTMEVPELAEPSSRLKVKLSAATQDGKPMAATVHLFAVDEGILALTGYKTPDIFSFFHGSYGCTLNSYDLYGMLFPHLTIKGMEKIGGDASAMGERVARLGDIKHDKDAVVVLAAVSVPAIGTAEVELELPEHTGAMRIMAVAAGEEAVGSESACIRMRHKASALPMVPLFVSKGDRFSGIYKLINHELDATEAVLKLEIPKELQAEGSQAEYKVSLPKGEQLSVRVPLEGKVNGAFTIRHELLIGGKRYAGSCIINCRSRFQYVNQSRSFILKPGESVELQPNADDWDELKSCEVKLASSPAIAVADALDWLNKYPYGCLEQTVSTAFPFLYVDELIAANLVDKAFAAQTEAKIKEAVARVLMMKRGKNGFSMWPESTWIWEEVGPYAAHFLFAANPSELNTESKKEILQYLEEVARNSNGNNWTQAAYALYVQSLASRRSEAIFRQAKALLAILTKQPASTVTTTVRNNDLPLPLIPPQEQVVPAVPSTVPAPATKSAVSAPKPKQYFLAEFFLGAAMFQAGHAADGADVISKALDDRCWQSSSEAWFLSADCTRIGMILSIAMKTVPKHAATLEMAFLLAQKIREDGNGWGSTRDNAWAAMGLGAFASGHPVGESSYSLLVGEKNSEGKFLGTRVLPVDEKQNAMLKNTGKTDLFVRLLTKGMPKKLENDTSKMRLRKELYDSEGKPVTTVSTGDLLTVRIYAENTLAIDSFVLLDLLPGGFAIEEGTLATRQSDTTASSKESRSVIVRHKERHDDRFLVMGALTTQEPFYISYRIRAIAPGHFAVPPVRLEDMYNPDLTGTFVPEEILEVK